MSASTDLYQPEMLKQADRWREMYNPLVGLNFRLIVGYLYNQQLGNVSDISWLYRFIERRDPVLMALIARRTSALGKLDWNIKTIPEKELPEGATKDMADAQAEALQTAYDGIDNVNEAICWLAMATFRGFSHLEIHFDKNGQPTHLEPVPQWNWARCGLRGFWYYNKAAFQLYVTDPAVVPPQLSAIDEENFIIREVEYPVDEIAVIAFMRKSMSQKDWDGFVATYGIPPLFAELPPDAPAPGTPEASAYQKQVERVVSDSRGVMPNGTKMVTVDAGARGVNPFLAHITYQDQMIVLSGTGGQLTMLTASGSGTLAGGAHKDTFDSIAEAEAKDISEIFQKQFDARILAEQFPDQPVLAYFQIESKELTDTSQVVKDVLGLAQGGYEVDLDQLEEKTGYRLSVRPPTDKAVDRAVQGNPDISSAPATENRLARGWRWLMNRAGGRVNDRQEVDKATDALFKAALKQLNPAQALLLKPLRDDLAWALSGDPAGLKNRLETVEAKLPALLKQMNADDSTAKIFSRALSASYLNGRMAAAKQKA